MTRRPTVITALVAAMFALAVPSAGAATLRAYRLEQAITLQPSQQATFSLACDAGDPVTDGVWNVEGPQRVAVLEARAFSGSAYRFTVRDDDGEPAQLHLYVVCQDAAGRVSPAGRAVTTAPGALRCRTGTLLVAPGFGPATADPGLLSAVLTRRTGRLAFGLAAPGVSGRCVRPGGARLRMVAERVVVTAGRISSYGISCADGGLVATSTLRLTGARLVGQVPRGRARTITLAAPGPQDGEAVLGARCLHPGS